uniref:Endoribonuclease n=1 Tax=Acrobeloides nanus TaxID=290746 RepID=A0A914ELR9_9BILA
MDVVDYQKRFKYIDISNEIYVGMIVEDEIKGGIKAKIYCVQLGLVNLNARDWDEMMKLGDIVYFRADIYRSNQSSVKKLGSYYYTKTIINVQKNADLVPSSQIGKPIANKTWMVKVDALVCTIAGNDRHNPRINKQGYLWNDLLGRIYLDSSILSQHQKNLKTFDAVQVIVTYDGSSPEVPWTAHDISEIYEDSIQRRENIAQLLITDSCWQIVSLEHYTNESYRNKNGEVRGRKGFHCYLFNTITSELAYARWIDLNTNASWPHENNVCTASVFKHAPRNRKIGKNYEPVYLRAVVFTPIRWEYDPYAETNKYKQTPTAYHPIFKTTGCINKNGLEKGYEEFNETCDLPNNGTSINQTVRTISSKVVICLGKKKGSGKYGTIYEGIFENNTPVAVKCVSREAAKSITQENRALRDIKNDFIVKYYCTEYDWSHGYIILELADCDLQTYVLDEKWQNKFDKINVINIFDMAIKGLTYIHSHKIVHRDIKPTNYLLKDRGDGFANVLLTDFGQCKIVSSDEFSMSLSLSGIAGTRDWLSPEASRELKKKIMTKEVDVFSLGLVYYFVLAGEKIFKGLKANADFTDQDVEQELKQLPDKGFLDLNEKELAINLIIAMLKIKDKERPSAETICNHPLMWSKETKCEFLCKVSEIIENDPTTYANVLNEDTEDSNILGCNWIDHIEIEFDNAWASVIRKGKRRRYGKTVRDLLRAVRNKCSHENKDSLRIIAAINNLFPRLLLHVYKEMLLHYKDEQHLLKYYSTNSHLFFNNQIITPET